MSRKRQPLRIITRISTRFIRRFLSNIKKQLFWLLRTVFRTQKRQKAANAGFVLPTVAMVSVVVILLTTAIMLRSFDRAKNASNVRVNEAVLNAATPAIDRGRAKINKLFQDTTLPRATPTDDALYTLLTNKIDEYTFGDETKLKLEFDIDGDNTIEEPATLSDNETVKTAWRFPVDTDNNGKFDSYTLYGILFRTPKVTTSGQYARARNPLEARTPPMAIGSLDANCGAATSASLVGNTGWVKQESELKKSFFVYTATVPITSTPTDTTNYETYKGNSGFAAVEYQQDRVQIPPNNVAVVYEDDISLTPGAAFNLNGAVFTNSNFLASSVNGGAIRFYQVSSSSSCYYEATNAKIIVGGNTALGGFVSDSDKTGASVDLYKGKATAVTTTDWVKSATTVPKDIAYNNLAYVNRINQLIDEQIIKLESTDPSEVTQGLAAKETALGITLTGADRTKYRRQQLELYFKKRTRRVPYKEVAFNGTDTPPSPLSQGSGDTLRPNDAWIYPTDPTDGKTDTNYAKVGLNISESGISLSPTATEPIALKNASGVEGQIGDRILVGNNLPQLWWDQNQTPQKFVGPGVNDTQNISGVKWDAGDTTKTRTRRTLVQTLADVGSTDRDGEWELAAAKIPVDISEPVGGLRVVTGAGIYLNDTGTPASFNNTITTIWPDTYPVPQVGVQVPPANSTAQYDATNKTIAPYWLYDPTIKYKWREITNTNTPYLQMRATAVYHYNPTGYNAQTPIPIACVSSYYVPTNSTAANNQSTLPDAAGITKSANGFSNNGIVYPAPYSGTAPDYSTVLTYQSQLTYPNGRLIDDGLLARALAKTAANRTISEKSAIDAQMCALRIKYDSTFEPVTSSPVIPHGAIREIAFLDARQVKQNSGASGTPQTTDMVLVPSTTYDLPVKDRQPLEIRATVLDLNLLRTTAISGKFSGEYLLPNSGIIYATRDDALPDMSADITTFPLTSSNNIPTEANKLVSPVDYKLDPTRRPNAIMLVNGSNLERVVNYRQEEKGLILATNLPVYIKGDFNLHSRTTTTAGTPTTTAVEEFTTTLASDYSNFYNRTALNPNFACRPNDPRLPSCTAGDQWRTATVLSDAVTLLSSNFREGFRNEGDYDWNNSLVGSPPSGFAISQYNAFGSLGTTWADTATGNAGFPKDFVTDVSGQADTTGYQGSSYVNNFVTPLIRMIPARQYAYEICSSTVYSDCFCSSTDTDDQCAAKTRNWSLTNVDYNGFNGTNGQNNWRDSINANISAVKTGFIGSEPSKNSKYSDPIECPPNQQTPPQKCKPDWGDLPYKRIAIERNTTTTLPVTPLTFYGSDGSKVAKFEIGQPTVPALAVPTVLMPWFSPASDSSTVLNPVLQVQKPFATETTPDNTDILVTGSNNKNWLQQAGADTTFNLIVASGDNPARSNEDNGGLHNFVRFMESWNNATSQKTAKISGSFMQIKKSAYATGTFATALSDNDSNLLYAIDLKGGGDVAKTASGFLPPRRVWGYDVGLLSQSPDLFASKLVLTPPDLPDEYFREVGRDDKWVTTLLCAKTATGNNNAIDTNQRPSNCPS